MSGRPRLRTVVADTSALVSLAVPSADETYDTATEPDPLQYVLTSCAVSVPSSVVTELREIAQYSDIHAAAAHNVLAARSHYDVDDPYERSETPESRPTFGLDDGETDGIVLANTIDADGFLTDEFGAVGSRFDLGRGTEVAVRFVVVRTRDHRHCDQTQTEENCRRCPSPWYHISGLLHLANKATDSGNKKRELRTI